MTSWSWRGNRSGMTRPQRPGLSCWNGSPEPARVFLIKSQKLPSRRCGPEADLVRNNSTGASKFSFNHARDIPNRSDDEGSHINTVDHTNVFCVTLHLG